MSPLTEEDFNPTDDPAFKLYEWITPQALKNPASVKQAYIRACNALVGRKFRAACIHRGFAEVFELALDIRPGKENEEPLSENQFHNNATFGGRSPKSAKRR